MLGSVSILMGSKFFYFVRSPYREHPLGWVRSTRTPRISHIRKWYRLKHLNVKIHQSTTQTLTYTQQFLFLCFADFYAILFFNFKITRKKQTQHYIHRYGIYYIYERKMYEYGFLFKTSSNKINIIIFSLHVQTVLYRISCIRHSSGQCTKIIKIKTNKAFVQFWCIEVDMCMVYIMMVIDRLLTASNQKTTSSFSKYYYNEQLHFKKFEIYEKKNSNNHWDYAYFLAKKCVCCVWYTYRRTYILLKGLWIVIMFMIIFVVKLRTNIIAWCIKIVIFFTVDWITDWRLIIRVVS